MKINIKTKGLSIRNMHKASTSRTLVMCTTEHTSGMTVDRTLRTNVATIGKIKITVTLKENGATGRMDGPGRNKEMQRTGTPVSNAGPGPPRPLRTLTSMNPIALKRRKTMAKQHQAWKF